MSSKLTTYQSKTNTASDEDCSKLLITSKVQLREAPPGNKCSALRVTILVSRRSFHQVAHEDTGTNTRIHEAHTENTRVTNTYRTFRHTLSLYTGKWTPRDDCSKTHKARTRIGTVTVTVHIQVIHVGRPSVPYYAGFEIVRRYITSPRHAWWILLTVMLGGYPHEISEGWGDRYRGCWTVTWHLLA